MCTPVKIYYKKVGSKGVKIIKACFHDVVRMRRLTCDTIAHIRIEAVQTNSRSLQIFIRKISMQMKIVITLNRIQNLKGSFCYQKSICCLSPSATLPPSILNPGNVEYELGVLMVWTFSQPERISNPWPSSCKLRALTTRPPSPPRI